MAYSMSCMCYISAVYTVQPAFKIGPLFVQASNRSKNGRQTNCFGMSFEASLVIIYDYLKIHHLEL